MAERVWFRPREGLRVWKPFEEGLTIFPPEGDWTELTSVIRKMVKKGSGTIHGAPPQTEPLFEAMPKESPLLTARAPRARRPS